MPTIEINPPPVKEQKVSDANVIEFSDENIIEVSDLSVVRSGKMIISNIDLNIKKGEFVGLVGPNGSGKTTLLLAIIGLLKINSGSVSIYGQRPMSRILNGKIGWVSQAASNLPQEIRLTVRELVKLGTLNSTNMLFWSNPNQAQQIDKAIKMVGLEDVEHIDVARLSGGQRQRAVIARALASNAELILLDEPLVGIDRSSRNSLLKLLDQLCHDEGKTILIVTHEDDIAHMCKRIVNLKDGIIISDSKVKQLRAKNKEYV